jgi:hypothetical protein
MVLGLQVLSIHLEVSVASQQPIPSNHTGSQPITKPLIQKLNIANIKFVLFLSYLQLKTSDMAKPEKILIKDSEKELRKIIQQKMSVALADHKNGMDEKDFQNSLKKASKVLSKEITGAAAKKLKKENKASKKKAKKKKEFLM